MGNCLGIAADPEYLRAARALCDKYGVLLVIDEVKTGFRVAKGGAQELYGVNADLCTFAKAVANGYPISVLAGAKRSCERSGAASLMVGRTPRIRYRWPRRIELCRFSTRRMRWSISRGTEPNCGMA